MVIDCAVSLAVVALYYMWRKMDTERRQCDHDLRERVAYLLWTAAQSTEDEAAPAGVPAEALES